MGLSRRNELWLERNVLSNLDAVSHVKDVLLNNNLTNYEFKKFNDEDCLFLYYEDYCYIFCISKNKIGIDVLQKKYFNNRIRCIGHFEKATCWINSIRWIAEFEKN